MVQFGVALALTVLSLGLVVWSGVTHRRRTHYALVVGFFGVLVWTIIEAEAFGATLQYTGLAATFRTVHFVAVTITLLMAPFLVWSGIALARSESPNKRAAHKNLAALFLALVVLTCGLGTAMTVLADPVGDDVVSGSD